MKTWEDVYAEGTAQTRGFTYAFRCRDDLVRLLGPAAHPAATGELPGQTSVVARRDCTIRCVDFSCDGQYAAAGTKDGRLVVHEVAKLVNAQQALGKEGEAAAASPRAEGGEAREHPRDARDVPAERREQRREARRVRVRPLLDEATTSGRAELSNLRWHPSNPAILATITGDMLKIWDVRLKPADACIRKGDLKSTEANDQGLNIRWHPSGRCVYVSTTSDFLAVYAVNVDYDSPKLERIAANKFGAVRAHEFDLGPDGNTLFACMDNGTVDVFSVTASKPSSSKGSVVHHQRKKGSVQCAASSLYCIGIDPHARYIAVGGHDSVVTFMTPDTLETIGCFARCTDEVRSLSFSHDGELLCVLSKRDLFVLHAGTRKVLLKFPDLPEDVSYYAARWHPKHYRLLYCTDGARGYREEDKDYDLGCVQMWAPPPPEGKDDA